MRLDPENTDEPGLYTRVGPAREDRLYRAKPDLSLKNATLDFLDRVFWAHWGYTPNQGVSDLLSDPTGGFNHPRYQEWIIPELITGGEYITLATEQDIEHIPAGTNVIFSHILDTSAQWNDQQKIAVCRGVIDNTERELYIFACNLRKT